LKPFTPGFGRQPSPVTFNGLTYSSPTAELVSDVAWPNLYPDWPNASKGAGLYEQVSTSQLQIDFLDLGQKGRHVRRFGVQGREFILKAYDDGLNEIGTTTATMPGDSPCGVHRPAGAREHPAHRPHRAARRRVLRDCRRHPLRRGRQPPNITVSPSPATFAATLAGQTRDLDVVVTNTGGQR
jgi:hypothetical protein